MPKRILVIDGGGIKGIFPAAFFAEMERQIGASVGQYFDLIVGTSTGGILALALGFRLPATSIVDLYKKQGVKIFGGNSFLKGLKSVVFAKHSSEPLRKALVGCFEERRIGESQSRLVIPSFNIEDGSVHVFKTSHNPRLTTDGNLKAVEVALATSAAPTYFMTHRLNTGTPLVDGGVWANNPIGVAAVEAVTVLGWNPNDLQILSLGCTASPLNINHGRNKSVGMLYWGTRVADLFMAAQSSGSLGTASLLIGKDRITRINPMMPEGRFSLDKLSGVESLQGLGYSEARKAIPDLRPKFFSTPADHFTPSDGATTY